jgi:hypothetical protein
MIGRLAPELRDCKTVYGFSIADKPFFIFRILPYIKLILGLNLFNSIYKLRKKRKKTYYDSLVQKHSWLNDLVDKTRGLKLPLHYDKLAQNDFLSLLLIEMGFFLEEMENYIEQ